MIAKDLFIEHDYSQYLRDVLDSLMCEPRHGRMPCWLIAGDAGMGKTAQMHRFVRRYPDRRAGGEATLHRPIVIVNVPPEPTRVSLEIAILEALNAPSLTLGRRVDRAAVIRRLLTLHETRGLVFDEIQHICYSESRERGIVLDAIKAFSTTCQLSVICAGTPAAVREFHADAQLERRFSVTQFVPWRSGPELQRFLLTYERARPLRLPSYLASPEKVRELLAEAGGITHKIMQCLNAAAIVAVHEGIERITSELLTVQRTAPGRVLAARRRASTLLMDRAAGGSGSRDLGSAGPQHNGSTGARDLLCIVLGRGCYCRAPALYSRILGSVERRALPPA
jgi:hypothetical protein